MNCRDCMSCVTRIVRVPKGNLGRTHRETRCVNGMWDAMRDSWERRIMKTRMKDIMSDKKCPAIFHKAETCAFYDSADEE